MVTCALFVATALGGTAASARLTNAAAATFDAQSSGVASEASGASAAVWAVVIGIDQYPGSGENLASAKADAGDMEALLTKDGVPADHRLTLFDQQASGTAIRAAADWLVAHSTDATTAVLFYAGHVDKLSQTTEAIRGSDGDAVTDGDLADHLHDLHARNTWITIAGCFAGGFDELLGPGRVLVAASDANHLSYENERLGRSYLVEYMIRRALLQGAADSSVQAAYAYAVAAISHDFPNRVPLMFDDTGGPFDLRDPAPALPSESPAGTTIAATKAPPRAALPAADATPPPPPIATITAAIDKVGQLRDRLASWLARTEPLQSRTDASEVAGSGHVGHRS